MALVVPPHDNRLILQFDLDPGRNADAITAAEALIAWVEAAREANHVMDPMSVLDVDLISADAACLRLWTAIKFIDRKAAAAAQKLDEVPFVKKLVVATVLGVPPGVIGGLVVVALQPEATVHLSPDGRAQYEHQNERVQRDPVVQQKVQKFYQKTTKDPGISRVSISERRDGPPLISVPRSEFPERSGIWLPQEEAPAQRPAGGIWDVIVTHPVAIGRPLTWGFMRDGLPFKAKITDERFLAGIRDKTLHLEVQEGAQMKVEVTFQEELHGSNWVPVPGTWEIPRVLEPRPKGPSAPTLPLLGKP